MADCPSRTLNLRKLYCTNTPIPTLYQQQQHNLPLTSSLPLHSSSPHSSLSSSPCSSKSTTSIRGRRVRLQKRARQREDTTGEFRHRLPFDFYTRTGQAESPASLPPPSPSLSVPRVGEKVLASWRRDNKWYVATIEKITETRAHISYLDGDHGQLQLSSLLPLVSHLSVAQSTSSLLTISHYRKYSRTV